MSANNRPFRKVFEGVATRTQMFALFDRHGDAPMSIPCPASHIRRSGSRSLAEYHFMLGLLPPLFQRTGMFGMSEYKAGNVTSVFFAIRIRGRERWYHGFCDLFDKRSPDVMRAAIIAHETGAVDSMTRAEKIEAIWSATHADFKGIAGEANPDAWSPEHHGKRTILVYAVGQGAILKLLEDLSDEEIDSRMPAVHARPWHGGSNDAAPS
jgi:hypothetical protein